MKTIELNDAMDYKNLDAEQMSELLDACMYLLMDLADYTEQTEPYAARTIDAYRNASRHITSSDYDYLEAFITWLNNQ